MHKIINVINITLSAWLIISWLNVAFNCTDPSNYWTWNFFVVFRGAL